MHNIPVIYEWNEDKRRANQKKHGVDFAAIFDFAWELALVAPDQRRHHTEERFRAISFVGVDLFVVVYTNRKHAVRVISMRRATNQEKRIYAEST